MISELSTFGKLLIGMGYLLAALLFIICFLITAYVVLVFSGGIHPEGAPITLGGWVDGVLGLLWLWSSLAAVVILTRRLGNLGSVKWCRVLAGYICLFIPFGTVFGVLVFVYLRKQST